MAAVVVVVVFVVVAVFIHDAAESILHSTVAGISIGPGTVPGGRGVCKLKHCWLKQSYKLSLIAFRNLAGQSENCITYLMSAINVAVSVFFPICQCITE